ncbi:hypothetical protein Mgra_00008448 [Meloidogyne graminicola]|uniref:Uncharacterized protein n=1 Tax=Meloidogyne graminicola TaxID=189291 RepID=A0A8S9ZFP1_9BILA|nr:hypothetical protein Mgra_00008448 [Meloidogyne graminicola]
MFFKNILVISVFLTFLYEVLGVNNTEDKNSLADVNKVAAKEKIATGSTSRRFAFKKTQEQEPKIFVLNAGTNNLMDSLKLFDQDLSEKEIITSGKVTNLSSKTKLSKDMRNKSNGRRLFENDKDIINNLKKIKTKGEAKRQEKAESRKTQSNRLTGIKPDPQFIRNSSVNSLSKLFKNDHSSSSSSFRLSNLSKFLNNAKGILARNGNINNDNIENDNLVYDSPTNSSVETNRNFYSMGEEINTTSSNNSSNPSSSRNSLSRSVFPENDILHKSLYKLMSQEEEHSGSDEFIELEIKDGIETFKHKLKSKNNERKIKNVNESANSALGNGNKNKHEEEEMI